MLPVRPLTNLDDIGEVLAEKRTKRRLPRAAARLAAPRALGGVLGVEHLERLRQGLAVALEVLLRELRD